MAWNLVYLLHCVPLTDAAMLGLVLVFVGTSKMGWL
jgi:hypothetical protein